jgi:hypothetical protein
VLVVCLSVVFGAQASEPVASASSDAPAAVIPAKSAGLTQSGQSADATSREIRENSDFSFNVAWAPVHVPFPMALGFNANYVASGNWMFGIDYLSSNQAIKVFSYELGELKEQSLTLQARRFYGNSFNWKMGIGHRRTEARLAQNFFDLVNNNYSLTASELRSNFFRLGFGNQWQISKKYTLVVDWFTVNIPFNAFVQTSASQYANSPSSKQDIENAENILKYYPSGSIVQFEAGLIF